MWFRNLFNSVSRGRNATRHSQNVPAQRRWAPVRLNCEALEDRAVPASLSVSDAVIVEGDAGTQNAMVSVRLSAPSNTTVTVNYSTSNGSAVAGSDYTAVSGKLTFAPGQAVASILVPVKGDRLAELDETVYVTLSRAKNAQIGDAWGVVTILDNEPRFSISDAAVTEGNAGATLMTFTVSLERGYNQSATVNYATQDGTATVANNDYLSAAGTLTFAPGETTKTFTVVVNGDTVPEADKAFFVYLSSPSANSRIVQSQATGTIVDDDGWVAPEPDPGYYDYGYDSAWWYGYWWNSNTGPGEYW